jgi:hypothetical protein
VKPLRIITSLLFAVIFSFIAGSVTGLSPLAFFGGIALLSALADKPTMALFTAIDISELVAALGDYYREHRDIIVTETLLDQSFYDKFNVMDDVTDELPLPNLAISNIIKPGADKTFNPTADALKFGARILKVRDVKFDLLIVPTVLHKTWLGAARKNRRSDGSHDPWEIPFEQFIFNYISQNAREQLHLQAAFKGVYNAAGTTPADTMTGFASLVTELITNDTIVPVTTGAITSDNIIESVEAVYDALGEAYKGQNTEMKVEPQYFDWYARKYRGTFGGNMDYAGMKRDRLYIDGSNCELVREPGLAGTGRMICSPKENFIYGCDTAATATMDIQKFDRTLKILGDFKAGVQFAQAHSRALSTNLLATDV